MPDKGILDFFKKINDVKGSKGEWLYYIAGLIDNDENYVASSKKH